VNIKALLSPKAQVWSLQQSDYKVGRVFASVFGLPWPSVLCTWVSSLPCALSHWPCLGVVSHIRDYTTATCPIRRCQDTIDQRPHANMGHHVPFIFD
jgi:hypothetical protein